MGGYLCLCTVASADLWKLGQLRAGSTVRFQRISHEQAVDLLRRQESLIEGLVQYTETSAQPVLPPTPELVDLPADPRLHEVRADSTSGRPGVVFRQAGDSAILVEFGEMTLDFMIRARIHAFETEVRKRAIPGVWFLAPCIRSTMVHFNPLRTSQSSLLAALIEVEASLPASVASLTFPGRKITFPVVLDDRWNRDALEKYMRSIRDKAVYLPSNIEYLARNNGLKSAQEALKLLVETDWLVLGVGFYLACPFLVPIDPRCRLVGQKMNPSRTYTPRGAIGIAGVVAAIYPIESPGGYQLYGRTLPPWQTWGKGPNFAPDSPWLLRPFDQVTWEVVNEADYVQLETRFDAGQLKQIEDTVFSMADYTAFVSRIAGEVKAFKERQAIAVAAEEARESELFSEWDRARRADLQARQTQAPAHEAAPDGGEFLASSLTAHVWKIKCAIGDVIKTPEDVLMILEAMKTEVNVEAGDEFVGRTIKAFGRGVVEGGSVQAGDPLIYFQ
ncbi:hypothetical protein NUW54_g6213 [Trametes sanguinea]|uniref:Uncharacterized protein n=1 Tax=Trametes sanguinea TaxID=158606 RepID=A0ACC1PUJ8_9APHY|nr:hypothetical protein NUW54_g6213 [Trametes sanguinea]